MVRTFMSVLFIPLTLASPAHAQMEGELGIHDPSTIVQSDGKYWTFGTRGGGLKSNDGWTWQSGGERPGGGVAPDVVKIGDRYLVSYAIGGGGMGGGHASDVKTMWTKSLDPTSPEFGFTAPITVASSSGRENVDAIDPAFLFHDGRLWLSYGTYFGSIQLIELDPVTGGRKIGNQPVDVAIDMEATALMFRDGWYYLLGTHGTCCDGPNSTYHIRVGRSRSVTGPYVDNMGNPLLKGGGKLVINARGRDIGPGHFGHIDIGDGVEKFSMHYEADMNRGRSVLGIRPLLWRDGWPVAGENLRPGAYEIESVRSGYALQLRTDFVRIPYDRRRAFGQSGTAPAAIPDQTLDQVSSEWHSGTIGVDLGDYMNRPNQRWTVEPEPGAGGVMGSPYYRIVLSGTTRALAVTAKGEVEAIASFTGLPEQLWRIDQLTDGSYRIQPKVALNGGMPLALVALGATTPTLAPFDSNSDAGRWVFNQP